MDDIKIEIELERMNDFYLAQDIAKWQDIETLGLAKCRGFVDQPREGFF